MVAVTIEDFGPGELVEGLFGVLVSANVVEGDAILRKFMTNNAHDFQAQVSVAFSSD